MSGTAGHPLVLSAHVKEEGMDSEERARMYFAAAQDSIRQAAEAQREGRPMDANRYRDSAAHNLFSGLGVMPEREAVTAFVNYQVDRLADELKEG